MFIPEECEAPVSKSVRCFSQVSASAGIRRPVVRPGSEGEDVHSPFERRVVVLDAGGLAEHARLDVPHEVHAIHAGEIPRTDTPRSAPMSATVRAEEPPRPEPNGTPDQNSMSSGSPISRASRSDPTSAVRGVREELGRVLRPLLEAWVA